MRIALDAFGSDNAPFPEVEGAILAIKEDICSKIFLVGDEVILANELKKFIYDTSRIEIVHAPDRITMNDHAAASVKGKQESSLVVAVRLYKEGIVDAVVSAGNTGAVMTASLFTYGRIKNISRPAIAITVPTLTSYVIILDAGANVDCTPENLVQFSKLGNLYAKFYFNITNPKVGLLNIGEESTKGNDLTKKTYQLLEQTPEIHFSGNVEGKDVLKGVVDVIVCDGFVGNVILKTVEGAAMAIFSMIREQMKKDWVARIGAILSYPVYAYLKKKLDHREYGGALLVGLNGLSIIAHGRSDAKSIKNAVRIASKIAESGFIEHAKICFEKGE